MPWVVEVENCGNRKSLSNRFSKGNKTALSKVSQHNFCLSFSFSSKEFHHLSLSLVDFFFFPMSGYIYSRFRHPATMASKVTALAEDANPNTHKRGLWSLGVLRPKSLECWRLLHPCGISGHGLLLPGLTELMGSTTRWQRSHELDF